MGDAFQMFPTDQRHASVQWVEQELVMAWFGRRLPIDLQHPGFHQPGGELFHVIFASGQRRIDASQCRQHLARRATTIQSASQQVLFATELEEFARMGILYGIPQSSLFLMDGVCQVGAKCRQCLVHGWLRYQASFFMAHTYGR